MCALRCLLCRIYYISKISMEQLEIKTQWFDDESCVHLNWIKNHARAFVFLCVCVFIHFVHRMVQIIWIEIIFQCLPFKMARTLVFIRSCLMWASAHGLCVKSWTQQTRAYFCGIHFKNKARSHTLNASEQLVTIYGALCCYFLFFTCVSV